MKFILIAVLFCASLVRAATLPELFKERTACLVAVEFFTETELDRRPTVTLGVVADAEGVIVLPAGAINPRVQPSQLKDFRVYQPGKPATEFAKGEYLGQDSLTGWHFVRVEEKLRAQLKPVTTFAAATSLAEPALGEEFWGLGLRGKDEDFMPYFMTGKVGLVQSLPERTAVALAELASPGLPVFNRDGALAGLAMGGFGSTYIQFSRTERGSPLMLMNMEESRVFQLVGEILPRLKRVPTNPYGRPLGWLGVYGLQPIDPEVAAFLKLENQSGCVVSEVLENSPAQAAGLKERDIILSIDGKALPRLKPDRVVVAYVERELALRKPGNEVALSVLRGSERVELKATLVEEPKLQREAERTYLERLGFTAREFVYGDAIVRRAKPGEASGIVVHFVKNNSPVSTAGLRTDDWIVQVDGEEVTTFTAALERLTSIDKDATKGDCVLVVNRGGQTEVLRVRLR